MIAQHIKSRKHQRFATNDANFLQLDCVLARVRRRTKQEVQEERMKREAMRKYYCRRTRGEGGRFHEDQTTRQELDACGNSDRITLH